MSLSEATREQFNQTVAELVAIPSCSDAAGGAEGAVQAYVAEAMRRAGGQVRVIDADDVPGFLAHPLCCGPGRQYRNRPTVLTSLGPDDAPALLILAHSDTVSINNEPERWTYGPFTPVIDQGRLYGRGSCDDKWGVGALLILQRHFAGSAGPLPKRLIFASTVDEENGVGNGLLLLHLLGIQAETAFYLDGCDCVATIGSLGGSNLMLRRKHGLPAAFAADAAALAAACERLSEQRSACFDRDYWRDNPMRFGSVICRRDGADQLLIHFYTLPGESKSVVRAELEALVEQALGARREAYDLTYRQPWFEPSLSDPQHRFISLLQAAGARELGFIPQAVAGPKQDAFILRNHAGIPTVSFGCGTIGGPGQIHQPDEFLDLARAWQALRTACLTIRLWLDD